MKTNLDSTYIRMANMMAENSKAVRSKVGAILVTSHGVILPGYNGTVRGLDNVCENEVNGVLVTKPEVIHAELNCILKAAKEGISIVDSTVYITLSPCMQCSAMIAQSGIKRVVFLHKYRDTAGIDFLHKAGVSAEHINIDGNARS